jgi:mono/diheme cytochrome c family protein
MKARIAPFKFMMFGFVILTSVWAFRPKATSAQAAAPTRSDKPWSYDEIKKVPEKARLRQNPFESDPEAIQAGGKLFERDCAGCHGMKAEGGRRAPSLLRDEVQQATPGTLFWVLTNGVSWHGMPVWSKLPEPQRWQIVTFLKSFQRPSSPKEPDRSE